MQPHRVGIKLFATDSAAVRVRDFVPVFHSWIQRQCIDGHLLIDVHDYSHINNGPGILLVAHQGNFCTDLAEGKLGLLYDRKHPSGMDLQPALDAALRTALQAASLLEKESVFAGKLSFRKDEALVIFNDRLVAPNDPSTFTEVKPALSQVFGSRATFAHASLQPKDRLAVRVSGIGV